MKSDQFIVLFGYIFLIFGIFEFIFKIYIFGFKEFDFLWFCSITLFILGFGMILKNSVLLNSFLSIALLVQPFWILDYIWLTFFNTPLNGVSSFVFSSGYSFLQFILNARHMYMIPFGFFSVFVISRRSRGSYLFIPIFIILLLSSSYLLAPKYSNLNCVFESCLDVFSKIKDPYYFFFYTTVTIILSLFNALIINMTLKKLHTVRNNKYYKKIILIVFLFLLLISTISVVFAYLKYSKIPKYRCLEPDICADCMVNIKCSYIDVFSSNLTLVYIINNKENKDYVCDVFMRAYPNNSDDIKLANNSFIEAGKKNEAGHILPNPSVNSKIKLKLNCSLYQYQ